MIVRMNVVRLMTVNPRSAEAFDHLGPTAAFGRLEDILFRTDPHRLEDLREAFVEAELRERPLSRAA